MSSLLKSVPATLRAARSMHVLNALASRAVVATVTSAWTPASTLSRRAFGTVSAGAAKPKTDMFCYQCEQTEGNKGCTVIGVCGKDPTTAALQDVLIHSLKGLSLYADACRKAGIATPESDTWALDALFSTLTNVNFSAERIQEYINQADAKKESLKKKLGRTLESPVAEFKPSGTIEGLVEQGYGVGVLARGDPKTDDILGLEELIVYGAKGLAAYAAHAAALGKSDPAIAAYIYEAMSYIAQPKEKQTVGDLLGLALKCGGTNIRAMQLLYEGHEGAFGSPSPARVRTTPIAGKCLLVSGHDLHDLEKVLQLTEGKGINVYTHGEMLPAHGYPGLNKYKHLVGNYGGAWQLQKVEFSNFPGAILLTSNCLVEPRPAYKDRIFTTNAVGFKGVKHVKDGAFEPVVAKALALDGFEEDEPAAYTMTGFGHNAVLGIADKVIGAIQKGQIKNFFLIGGCDGSESERSYYRNFAQKLPNDAVVLTLGCAKYRFNKMFDKFGTVEGTGIPRLLDIGQCNDSYSAVQIALALASALKTDVNSLPLHFVLSWFEQKAVAVLLSLLHLGVKDIHIGPALPAFVTPNVLKVLVDNYRLTPIGDVEKDLNKFLQKAK